MFTMAQKGNTITDTILTDGIQRSFILYVPTVYNSSSPVPLLLNFHGLGSDANSQYMYTNFMPVADTANFIMACPQGLLRFGVNGWNCFGDVDPNIDDIRFVAHLIDTLRGRYNINVNKIYSTGFSNGGFMSYDLACFLSTRFAAIASVSGTMMANHLSECNPRHPIPVMHIHGTTDDVVGYNGVTGSLYTAHVDSIVKFWRGYNWCQSTPDYTTLPDINTADGCTAAHYVYTGGRGNTSVELYKITGGGHAWPGSPYNTSQGNTNRDFSATIAIWNFFRSHDKTMDIEENTPAPIVVTVYPNPAISKISLKTDEILTGKEFMICDIIGRELISGKVQDIQTDIDLSALNNGVYYVKIKSASAPVCKFIKNK